MDSTLTMDQLNLTSNDMNKNGRDKNTKKSAKAESTNNTSKVDSPAGPLRLGENTISMPLVYASAYGDLGPEIAPDILTELLAKIHRREDLVRDNELYTQIIGKTSIESERIAYRGVQSTAYWDKYYPEGLFPRDTFRIHFDSGVVVNELDPVLVEDFQRGGVVDSKKVVSCIRGELPANRNVAEKIAFLLNDSLVVFDLQYIYCIGHLMQFKIRDAELSVDAQVAWHVVNETIEYINMDPDPALVNDSIASFTNAVMRQEIILLARYYSDEDINVMRMIATGTQSMTLTVRGRRHVSDNFVSERLKFVLIGTLHRDMPPFEAPTIDNVSAFMRRFATDYRTAFDGVRGYIKACSIYFGRVLMWRVDDDEITTLCGPYTNPADDEHQEQDFRMPGPVGDGIPNIRPRDRINHVPSFPLEPAQIQVTPSQDQPPPEPQPQPKPVAPEPLVEYEKRMLNKRAIKHLIASNHEVLKAAVDARSQENVNICKRKGAELRAALEILEKAEKSRVSEPKSDLNISQPKAGPSTSQPNDKEAAAPKLTYHVDWLPASLEMGATSVPQPHGYNILWRMLRLCNTLREQPWEQRELKTWASLPRNELNRLGAALAVMLTLGQSYSLHVANFTATQLRQYAAGDDCNSRLGIEFLLNSANSQRVPAVISSNTCYFISRTFSLTMNPRSYFINRFAYSFIGPREYPPDGAYELWCGDRMLYLQHPLSLAWTINQFPSIWGISAPGVTVDLRNDVNLYLDTHDRGWYSDMGCSAYISQFTDFLEFQYVPYAMAVLNALWQHYDLQGVPPGLFVRYYARASQTANLMRTREYTRLAWDPNTRSFAIGSLVTYDWERKEVLALNISGAHAVRTVIRYMQDLRTNSLDAGYRVNSIITTHIPNTTGLAANMLGLFKLGRRLGNDDIALSRKADGTGPRRAGN